MKKRLLIVCTLLFVSEVIGTVKAQNNEFVDAKAHLSLGTGVFTYHGPADLLQTGSPADFVNKTDPAVALLGSFPLLKKWMHFRFMLLLTPFETQRGKEIVGEGRNDFITENLLVFEPTLVLNIRSLSTESVMPYVFTGFGGTIADAFGSGRDIVNLPGSGIPGPERSAFHIPIGVGVDYKLSERLLVFGEASWRMDMNYVFKNELDYEPHSTSLIVAGIRAVIGKRIRCSDCGDPDRKWPIMFDPLSPIDHPEPVRSCELGDLTPILFEGESKDLTSDEIKVLDDNFDALFRMKDCCADIQGFAAGKDPVPAIRLADERAEAIRDYLLAKGLSASRFRVSVETITERTCAAKGGGKKCPSDVLISIIPITCADFAVPGKAHSKGKDPHP